ncbi:MAG: hypothetical protein LBG92_06750, partial [Prevotellaceae bacterium]|nr:hypothetical protein [Prevotellaceae bacterium]
ERQRDRDTETESESERERERESEKLKPAGFQLGIRADIRKLNINYIIAEQTYLFCKRCTRPAVGLSLPEI